MRRALAKIHLWLGLVIGLLWAMQGLTGSVLVFHREVDRLTGPAATPGPMASLDAIVASAQAAAGGAPIVRLAVTDGRRDLINAFYPKASGGRGDAHDHSLHAVVIDAATAKPVGARDMEPATPFSGSAMRWVDLLHMALLGGRGGEIFIGLSGLVLLTATLTGLWIAWPSRRAWSAVFAHRRWRTSEQRLYGWHRAIGLVMAFVFIALASAGAYINFERDVRSWVARAVPHKPPYSPPSVTTLRVDVSPQQALDIAQRRFPHAVWVRIFMPTSQEPLYNVRLHQRGESRVWLGKTNVAVDPMSGDIVDAYDALTVPLSNRILDAAFPLHNGELAGLPGRILVVLAGLLLPALYVTGVMRWLRQRRRRRTPKPGGAPLVAGSRASTRTAQATRLTHRAIGPTLPTAVALVAARPAHAARPLQTEDAGVIAPGSCEVEGAMLRESLFGTRTRESALQLGCGTGARTQLAVAVTRVRTEEESARVLDLNGKTNLWQGERGATLAVAYAIMSAGVSGESFQHAATEVNLVYSRALHEDYALHVNLGHAHDEIIDTRTTTWAFAVEHSGFGPAAPMAEMFGDDETGAWWNVGLRYTVVLERFFIDGSYGRQMTSNGLTLRTIGFTVAF